MSPVDAILALLARGPLEVDRLTWLAYLIDWKAAIEDHPLILAVPWRHGIGPASDEMPGLLADSRISVREGVAHLVGRVASTPPLPTRPILAHVVSTALPLPRHTLLRLCYSTFPMLSSQRGDLLNLPDAARRRALVL